jgi:hypothetical protein
MDIFLILEEDVYGCESSQHEYPQGYCLTEAEAKKYCEKANITRSKSLGHKTVRNVYTYEPISLLKVGE